MKVEELNKMKMQTKGEQFVLDSQINVLLDQSKKYEETRLDFQRTNDRKIKEVERDFKGLNNQRFDLEGQIRSLDSELMKENEENYVDKMVLQKDQVFEKINNDRFQLELNLDG